MMTSKWMDISLQDVVHFLLFLSLVTVTGQTIQQSCHGMNIFSNISKPEINTMKSITDSDYQSCDALNQLIEIMEEVNILTARTTSCYSLSSISRTVGEIDKNDSKRKISVTFFFEENIEDLSTVQDFLNNKAEGRVTDKKAITKTSCQNPSSVKTAAIGRHFMSMQQQNGSAEDDNSDNSTVAAVPDTKEGTGGLSHTQVVVIATCSAVIGTFFLVAAALRIRNYVKRKRQEQSSRRSNCRNSGAGFQGSAGHLVEQVRRDSESSKASRRSSSTVKGGNLYFQINNGTSSPKDSPPKQNSLDTKPLLVVTAPSSVNTPTDSNTSIQFIDEEQDKNEYSQSKDPGRDDMANVQPLIDQENQSKMSDTNTHSDKDISIEVPITENCMVTECDRQKENDHLQCRSNIDGESTVTENKVPSSLPLDSQSDSEQQQIYSISVGLTQSDDSINSHNASYQYGNQVEYSWNSGYGNYAYCPNEIEIEESDEDSQSPLEMKETEMTNLDYSEDDGLENSLTDNQTVNCHNQSSFDILGESFDIPLDSPNGTDEKTKLLALQDLNIKGDNSCQKDNGNISKGCENVIDDVSFSQERRTSSQKNQLISQDSLV